MKKVLFVFALSFLSPDVFADADARRRTNCIPIFSYRYKAKASIYSLNLLNGKKEVRELDETIRNCNEGAVITQFKNALFFPDTHWGFVQAWSDPTNLFTFTSSSSPLIVDVGRNNSLFPLHLEPSNISRIPKHSSKSTVYKSGVKVGQSKFEDNTLIISDLEMFLSNGLNVKGLNFAQLLIYVEGEKELNENSRKVFELRLEYKDGEIYEFGEFSKSSMNSRFTDSEYEVTYKVKELKISIPVDVDTENITIRAYSDIRGQDTIEKQSVFRVYPNPSSGNFTVGNAQIANISWIKVYDSDSRELMQLNSVDNGRNVVNLDLSSLPEGVYYLHISSEGVLTRKRIVIEK